MSQTLRETTLNTQSPACACSGLATLTLRWALARSDQGAGELEIRVTGSSPEGEGHELGFWCTALINGRVLREGPAACTHDPANRQVHIDAPGLVSASVRISEGQSAAPVLLYARTAMMREVGVQGGQADAPRMTHCSA
ncbi:MAG: hypothetical protein IBJ18_02230 [Phycisphaerales bacterium]|nr:hypothetical protein [Phycisphaerales bacterium]